MQGPKRKDKVIYYKPTEYEDDMDMNQLLSFVFAFVGMIFKYYWAMWLSFFLILSSYYNMRNG